MKEVLKFSEKKRNFKIIISGSRRVSAIFSFWASLVARWLRIRLPMQGTRVRALGSKIPHAAEQLSPCATTTEPAL